MDGFDNTSYGDAFADVYDDWYADISDVEATVATLARLAMTSFEESFEESLEARSSAGPSAGVGPMIVELGVGTGRLAIPLAAAVPNAVVIGVDTSRAMLDRLRANDVDQRVDAICGDMVTGLEAIRSSDIEFDLVFVAYNTLFNLTADGAQAACFDAVARRLSASGRFVVEAFVPDEPPRGGSGISVRSIAVDRVVLSVNRHDPEHRSAEGQFVEITESGGIKLRPWSIRYSSPTDLDAMAAAAGLQLESRTESFDGTPFDANSVRHVSVYQRRPG